ncbi:unnamed protein product [Bursaphelenchus okinawaensis]|uniref:Helicase ATP-binding domain-containing protein n=1 Tax=Bursaphelenchus okinawaensis TaxID=465554 RepID=A0A811KK58_9BILA|nr:unnamed protein product [Bursaphelenchus okinawaensis]CAG9104657.1 unnamed protein product [Bursaphelenchus okinawaensis]
MEEGVRSTVIRNFCEYNNILELAHFQYEIVNNATFYSPDAKNVLFSAPTGSGKSLVAEIIACVNVLLTRKRCIFIQPYIASASELFFALQRPWRSLGLIVKAHFGSSSLSLNEEFSAVVCTIEKASSLINRIIKEGLIDEFCTIVIDEAHMVFDGDRGSILEDILIKLKALRVRNISTVQVIAMSATIEDFTLFTTLMDTEFMDYSNSNARDLQQFFVAGKEFYVAKDGGIERSDRQAMFNFKSDDLGILSLVMEVVIEWKSVLIFCQTKAVVEKTAKLLAMCIYQCAGKGKEPFNVLKEHVDECIQLSGFGFMDDCIKCGVAFHHSGVPNDARKKIEKLFKDRKLAVIVCTSTLSTGVNLPASRVVINLVGSFYKTLNYVTYYQMIGRTGRRGFGRGEF